MPSVKGNACLYCINCTKFGQLILRKIIKIYCHQMSDFKAKCTKFDFGWGSAPDPAGGAYSAPPDLLAGFNGPLRGREGEGKGMGKGGWEGTGRRG